ncbi:MAG: ATP-dependent zinc protease [Verrucomicrobiales bacterium]|nr:ATP-dependent zinc protease [Verrucomicrobiales bacterium]
MSDSLDQYPILGWREWLSIPSLGIPHIKAKVDTGARTSALHTFDLEAYTAETGEERVRFSVHPFQGDTDTVIKCDCPIIGSRSVRDSGGHEQIRPFIRIPVVLGDHTWDIEFSLTNRDNMKFRMLLGRTAMEDRFLVNPALSYQQSNPFHPPS